MLPNALDCMFIVALGPKPETCLILIQTKTRPGLRRNQTDPSRFLVIVNAVVLADLSQ